MSTLAQDEYDNLFRDKSHRTRHPADDSDNGDAASFLDDNSSNSSRAAHSHDENTPAASFTTSATASKGGRGYTIPTQRQQSNTGVKGVITDAQAYRDAERYHRSSMNASRTSFQQSLSQQRPTAATYRSHNEQGGGAAQTGYINGNNGYEERTIGEEDEDEDDAEQDDEFMDQWRRNRLKELQGPNGEKMIGATRREKTARRAHYGGLVPVDGEGYLEAVDGSGSLTVVVVFIYDDMSEVSNLIENCLAQLARKYINTRFIKLHYLDAEMEPAGVPALLAYRAGDKFAGLVPLVDELPDDADLSAATLERLFSRYQIL